MKKNDVLLDKNQNCFIIKNNNKNNELLEKYNYVDFTLISLSEVCNMYLLLKDKYIKINESITLYGGDCLKIFKVYDKKNISFVTNLFNTNCNDPLKQLENLIIKTTLVKAIDDINNLLLKY